jgi:hypothetical protein
MNPPETAPLDGTPILADFGWPWLSYAVFSASDGKWCHATLQCSHGQDVVREFYFENEYEDKASLKCWCEIDSMPSKPSTTQDECHRLRDTLDRISSLTTHDDIYWAIEEIARISECDVEAY